MQGLMMDMPLLISGLIQYAADYHSEAEIVAREIEGDIHRYTYADAHPRIKRMALALKRLGMTQGDRVGTLAWNTHRHFEMFYAAPGMGYVLHTINPRLFPSSSSTSSTMPRTGCCSSTAPRCHWSRRSRRSSRRSRPSS